MSTALWRIATDTKDYEAHELNGKGAEKTGGRWNRPGRPMVYCSQTIALSCLETVVHLNAGDLPLNKFLVRIEMPESVWHSREQWTANELPVGWNAVPEGKVSLDIGDDWLQSKRSALLVVPSVIVPEEQNVLINPLHSAAKKIKAFRVRSWFYDQRLG